MKKIVWDFADFKIWAYLSPFFWVSLVMVLLFAAISAFFIHLYNKLSSIYMYNSVGWCKIERVEKFVQSYYDVTDQRRKLLLNKETKDGKRLRNYTAMNLRRIRNER